VTVEIPQEKYLETYFKDREGWENIGEKETVFMKDDIQVFFYEYSGEICCKGQMVKKGVHDVFRFPVPDSYQKFKNIMDALEV
jgi:hypothetical protein